ncbi:HNH endonuclease [Priestia megaterium]|uniref:HNH endonuclease n=1 Tax=Priestia megaterium TaxID=1404 RepID=UPI00300AD543
MEEFVLIDQLDEVKRNMIQFNNDLKENEEMRRRFFSHFRQWYYIREIDMFAPSKFIGYKNMNASRYNNKNGAGADGRKTEVVLRKWFVKKEIPSLFEKLQESIGLYGRIKKGSKIHILKTEESYFNSLLDKPRQVFDATQGSGELLIKLLKLIPPLESVNRSREYNLYNDSFRDRVVYKYLFHSRTHRWLDEHILGLNPDESRGYQAMGILHFIGLKDKHKGIFKDLGIQEAIQLLEIQNFDFNLVIQSLQRYQQQDTANRDVEEGFSAGEYIELESNVTAAPKQIEITETEKEQVIKARIGQSTFKRDLVKIQKKCSLCGVSDERFLVASHIKPWSQSNHQERLDINNGLLLCPNHDSLFDKGYISFDDNGAILTSSSLDDNEKLFLNINDKLKIKLGYAQQQYMKWHRKNKFK